MWMRCLTVQVEFKKHVLASPVCEVEGVAVVVELCDAIELTFDRHALWKGASRVQVT
jgi:hypothetical protein